MSVSTYTDAWFEHDGVGYLRAMADGTVAHPSHSRVLGVRVAEVAYGRVRLTWEPPADLSNPMGTVHGGFIAGVLDMAAGLSAASVFERFIHHATIELRVDFVAPARFSGEAFDVIGEVVRPGRSTQLADAKLVDASGRMVARGSGTFVPLRNGLPQPVDPAPLRSS